MVTETPLSCVIVGASHAGVNAAFALRRQGWTGAITLLDPDPELPYHRPPLSKGFLSGETTVEDSPLRAASSYTDEQIDFRGGEKVAAILREDKMVQLAGGGALAYDKLILATGASPLVPPISGLTGNDRVFTLRTAADARRISEVFTESNNKRVVVIGAGYIGLEVAASLRKLGGMVTVLEREERVLARVTSPEMSAFFTELHTAEGVGIKTSQTVTAVETAQDDCLLVKCAEGNSYPADLVVVGVGVRANTGLASAAGLSTSRGIIVNSRTQTTDPDIHAIGDCTAFHHPRYGREVRLESVQNAVDQAKVAAANLCGETVEYAVLPWFWSDQFGVKLQMCGLAEGYDRLVVRQEAGDDPYQRSVWYFAGDQLLAVDAVNHARAYMIGMKLLKGGINPDPEKLKDTATKLHPKTLVG